VVPFQFVMVPPRGFERARSAERLARKSTTLGSASAPSPAAKAGAMEGRRLRRANLPFGTSNIRGCGLLDRIPFLWVDSFLSKFYPTYSDSSLIAPTDKGTNMLLPFWGNLGARRFRKQIVYCCLYARWGNASAYCIAHIL
jgi:hypothetical protein